LYSALKPASLYFGYVGFGVAGPTVSPAAKFFAESSEVVYKANDPGAPKLGP
jgi:hypothetical protein